MKSSTGAAAINRRTAKSDSAFRTISEAAEELGLQQHVLRFWESKFPQIQPMKRAGGRRYYRPEDLALLAEIQTLLHDRGFTIKGVQKLLAENRGKLPGNLALELPNAAQMAAGVVTGGMTGGGGGAHDGADMPVATGGAHGGNVAHQAGMATPNIGTGAGAGALDGVDRARLSSLLGELEALQNILGAALSEVKKNP